MEKVEIEGSEMEKWHLRVSHGRQTWHHQTSTDANEKQSIPSKYWSGTLQPSDIAPIHPHPHTPRHHAENGFNFMAALQTEDGHWAGEYGGPMFLIPGMVIVCHLTGMPLLESQTREIIRYLCNQQNADGGWGLHVADSRSSILGTSTNYVVLRLLGVDAEEEVCLRASRFLKANGGAVGAPSWGKFWLAVAGVYSYDGFHPVPPELWMLPSWLPFHPSKMWCHCRQIYLPMSYCYAHRLHVADSPLILAIRSEIYCQSYQDIDWLSARDCVSELDVYAPHDGLLDVANVGMHLYERFHSSFLRDRALDLVLDHIRAEDANSSFIGIGPISKVINMLVRFHSEGKDSAAVRQHYDTLADYLWLGPDGMRMNGTNGSQLWDTALLINAVADIGLASDPRFRSTIVRALEFLDDCQIKQNTPDLHMYFRQPSKGAFPFSTRDCGWIVSDCTAEGLKAVMLLQELDDVPRLVPDHRIFEGIDVLLAMQNVDCGFASYERRRGPHWLERLNPSEVFGEIMVDYSYTECSSAVLQVLHHFSFLYPDYRARDVRRAINGAIGFIKSQQREDGSWFGSWGVCFTYGMWFALEALERVGEDYGNSQCVRRGCEFLLDKQRPDGGWGESYLSCTVKVWVEHEESQVVNTAWALLALMAANCPDREAIGRGISLLTSRQCANGEWKQEGIEGVFNKTCMISYPNYKFIFPIWALGRYANLSEE